jgi:predicted transposase/invertase (TIGR01784 family)
MQILEDDDMPERVTYYNSKIFVTQLKSGKDFESINRTISIVIADFELVKNEAHPAKYHHRFMYNDCETGVNFTDIVEINTLELQKIPAESDNTPKYDWLKFLKAEREEEFDMLAERSPVIKEAVVELRRLSQDEEAQRLHDAREKALWGEQSRLRTAVNKRDREIALNFIKMGLTNEQISEGTSLPISEVEKQRAK